MKICFLDTVGLVYNGDTLNTKGLGGSESAIILLTKELAKIGMDVTVYNRCDKPGVYDNVKYLDLSTVQDNEETFDILISSRNVLVYSPLQHTDYILKTYNLDLSKYQNLVNKSNYKVLWMHDTFCNGDEFIQEYLADNFFNEIFTLSDWHYSYVSNATHVNKRYPELFKKRTFHTRNGIVNYKDEIDITKKDPWHFVYNASLPKGMKELVTEVWPHIKQKYPEARLTVIGGYYDLGVMDGFQRDFITLKENYDNTYGITFTGIIKQNEIADILENATYFIYPNKYPETFGISVTEAINYNVLLVGFNFGALEETVPDIVSYKTEFPYDFDVNQLQRYLYLIDTVLADSYLKQQKQYACNEFKPFLGWDVVALQWKHHFYKKFDLYLPIKELREHRYNISNINKMYKKVCINTDEYFESFPDQYERRVVIITPIYNGINYIKKCIDSVLAQDYTNYRLCIIDDASTDGTLDFIKKYRETLPDGLKSKILINSNPIERKGAIYNQFKMMYAYTAAEDIVMLLDGDDSLVNDPDIFNYYNRMYQNTNTKFTYGSCRSLADKIDLIAQPYPTDIIKNKTYVDHKFTWGMPYTHLRTFKGELFFNLNEYDFKDKDDNFYLAGADNAMFYYLIMQCKPDEIKCVQRVVVNYNDLSEINDYKVNSEEQKRNTELILNDIRSKRENYIK